ncbi:hypothetical protein [Microcoleus sp. CAWBG24]|uniref:hypothetical protein n=1 Tax=Microcoleus sp. CAWBG24 TaxID=2841644 RepID=UPI0025ECAF71|nr:hypothetical protein [Microcoleus sp. CAWBG24]
MRTLVRIRQRTKVLTTNQSYSGRFVVRTLVRIRQRTKVLTTNQSYYGGSEGY